MSSRFICAVLAGLAAAMAFSYAPVALAETPEEAAALDHMINPKDVVLTEDQVKRYIAFLKDNTIALKKIGDVQGNAEAVARAIADADAIPAKHGFNRLGDLIDIRHTIDSIVTRFNNETGEYIDPESKVKKLLAQKVAEPLDGKSAEEKAEHLADIQSLKESIAKPVPQMPENVALVRKYKKEILESR
ncbi:MAG: hypothetical protein ABL897_15455 [Hyphomicrobium sp.]